MRIVPKLILASLSLVCFSCGGSSSDSGILIEGTLIEGGGDAHENIILKHSSGENLENVQVCALGECSTTDAAGQWGFVAGGDFNGGQVSFTIQGHGIDTTTLIDIPAGASEVFLDLKHEEDGSVKADHITIDGETSHHEDDDHAHE